MKVDISFVIVNYKVEKELIECLNSIKKNVKSLSYEVIVVENNPHDDIQKKLSAYKFVTYVKSDANRGFGAGNNLGATYASGEYLFFLNPDTVVESGSINKLLELFINPKIGIVAPVLLDENKMPYIKQGTMKLTPITAFFSLSFISKYFPNNPISNYFWNTKWNKKKVCEIDVVPGTAFIIKKSLFSQVQGFDEHFFLYFEENDLCNRLKQIGYKIYISPDLKVIHKWGKSTKQETFADKVFEESRKYYFKKNYGLVGVIANALLSKDQSSKFKIFLVISCIFLLSLFLRTHNLSSVMQFIPDQGWFYLSARDMLLTGQIPLVGPPTSHPWIHHGPLWTYTLGVLFLMFNFNPVVPAYFIGVLGAITVLMFYYCVKRMFGLNTAIVSIMLFACSPLIVMNSRIAYHTSPIPFFVIILFFLVYKWIKGAAWVFPFIVFLLAVLYNHEITTFVYFICVGIVFMYGLFAKRSWFKNILKVKILSLSLLAFLIPMTPFILHDVQNGYGQTVKFLVWVGYRLVKIPLSFIHPDFVSKGSNPSTFGEFFTYYSQLIYVSNIIIPIGMACVTILYMLVTIRQYIFIKKYMGYLKVGLYFENTKTEFVLLGLFLGVGFLGLLSHRVPIEADTLLIAPFLIILTAQAILWITHNKLKPILVILLFITVGNVYYLLYTNFFTQNLKHNRITYKTRLAAVDKVIRITEEKSYTIVGRGELSSFPVFLMPYEYLLWWKGKPINKDRSSTQTIEIWENNNQVNVLRIK